MKRVKFLYCSLVILLLFALFPHKSFAISAHGAIVMEQESGRVLYEKNAHTQMRIASITKIMTAILAIESGKMDEIVTVSNRAANTEGSSLYLRPGDKVELKDLVYGLMLRSGNDAAVAIAEHVSGSLDSFVKLMNKKAKAIGMEKTVFANPHGLDDHEHHYSTAYDMALLTRYAQENKTYRKISSTKLYKATLPSTGVKVTWRNKNKLLNMYKYSTGGKTGYTIRAKRTLVSTAKKGDLSLIAVTLNDRNDWNDHISMFERSFKNYHLYEIVEKGTLENLNNAFYENLVDTDRRFLYPLTDAEQKDVSIQIQLVRPDPIRWSITGTPLMVGKLLVYLKDKQIGEIPLLYKNSSHRN
ncbi:D-alanyl-D-alanine carboxypeptidase family protein [Bacillus sp. Marseille-P3661]|uniref:D-alanyl-D-alanine carboxypeptidase family protein n=1 Tax=Bacillus sp. Marseille-P3661 TaxID=1936234 RepID=UPI000C82C370|nr:D-alanyl-D-alanine carboxypeptidase family protein [Bacillus sp. Marseille-P3661]